MSKKNFQKRKEREKEVRKKVLARRAQLRAETKEKAKWDREEKASAVKRKPLCSAEERRQVALRDVEIRKQLLHNMELLQALEDQYQKEGGAEPVEPHTITVCQGETGLNEID